MGKGTISYIICDNCRRDDLNEPIDWFERSSDGKAKHDLCSERCADEFWEKQHPTSSIPRNTKDVAYP